MTLAAKRGMEDVFTLAVPIILLTLTLIALFRFRNIMCAVKTL